MFFFNCSKDRTQHWWRIRPANDQFGGDNVVCVCVWTILRLKMYFVNRHRNTYHKWIGSDEKYGTDGKTKTKSRNVAAFHVVDDDIKKNVYPHPPRARKGETKKKKKWQQIRLFRRRFLSPSVEFFFSFVRLDFMVLSFGVRALGCWSPDGCTSFHFVWRRKGVSSSSFDVVVPFQVLFTYEYFTFLCSECLSKSHTEEKKKLFVYLILYKLWVQFTIISRWYPFLICEAHAKPWVNENVTGDVDDNEDDGNVYRSNRNRSEKSA